MEKNCETCRYRNRNGFEEPCNSCSVVVGEDIVDPTNWEASTNADRIRAMTDEELASVITDDWCEIVCSGTDYLCDGTCEQHVLKWLKEEVKDV